MGLIERCGFRLTHGTPRTRIGIIETKPFLRRFRREAADTLNFGVALIAKRALRDTMQAAGERVAKGHNLASDFNQRLAADKGPKELSVLHNQ
ncbi:MAG: hypothetical protein ACR65U_08735 [Methylocystis sp.]